METYNYQARNSNGKQISGQCEASSADNLKLILRKQGLWLTSYNQSSGSINLENLNFFKQKSKIKLKDMVVFTRQFAAMLESGIPILKILNILKDQTENPELANVIHKIKDDIEQGIPLSESMSNYPNIFDNLFIAMVKAGELGGVLDQVLGRVAGFLEARNKLSHKVQTALTYPISLLVIASLVTWFMLTFILPKFSAIFSSTGGELPAFTQSLINVSNFLRSPWVLVLVLVIYSIFYSFNKYYKSSKGKFVIDSLSLKLPIFGTLFQKISIARFSRTLMTLLESGVPITRSIEVTKESMNNAVLEEVLDKCLKDIQEGNSISNQLSASKLFPPMVYQMITIGEESGELEAMLSKIADFYDDEVDNTVESLTAIMEPLFIVVIGGIIGAIVVAMYLPIFNVINQI